MVRCILGWPNGFTGGTLAASSAEAALPVTNLANDQGSPDQGWQTLAGVTTARIEFAVTAPVPWRAFGLFRSNLTPEATVRWAVLDASGSAVYDSGIQPAGAVPGYGQTVRVAAAPVAGTHVTCDISDPGNPDGFLNVPLAFAGPGWQPFRQFDYASFPAKLATSIRTVTRAGGAVIRTDSIKRTFDLTLSGIRDAEVRPLLLDLETYALRGNNVLFVPEPGASTVNYDSLFGELAPSSGVTYPYKTPEVRAWRAMLTERL